MHKARLVLAALLVGALGATSAVAATKPSPKPLTAAEKKAAANEAARQAAQQAAGEFVTVAKAKRQGYPKWSGETMDGKAWKSASMNGRVTVVNFWASWCGPYKAEWDELLAAAKANPKVAFVGINTMDRFDSAQDFLKENTSPYLQVFDERGVMMASYKGIPHGVMPTTLILDAKGRIAAWRAGPIKEAQLQRGIRAVLATA